MFEEQTEKFVQQKRGNLLLFSRPEYKVGRLHMLAAEEQNTTSAQLKVLFVKMSDSPAPVVTWSKWIIDVGEFLKHMSRETLPFSFPTLA